MKPRFGNGSTQQPGEEEKGASGAPRSEAGQPPTSWHPYSGYPGQRPAGAGRPPRSAPGRSRQPFADGYEPPYGYPAVEPEPDALSPGQRRRGPRFVPVVLISVIAVVLLFFLVLCGLLATYAAIAADLPSPEELQARSASFLSTRIYDRNGHLLHEILDPTGGRRVRVSYDKISPYVINATVATEDARFWEHPGVDPVAVLRAIFYNVTERRVVSGFSSIPQQLVRLVLLSPEERTEQSLGRKTREVVLAAEVSRRYSKQDILTVYLNEINYGNLAYGIEAAAETYFGKRASQLTLAEAALLAGLPQAPAYWNPYADLENAKRRQAVVLDLMVEAGYITYAEAEEAKGEELHLRPLEVSAEAPHMVSWVQQQLERRYGTDVLYRSGLSVYTTIDSNLQAIAEEEIQAHLATLQDRNVTNASLVAVDPGTGEILAMVGSADFRNPEISGQVNISLQPRQPGSSIKPITYVSAFERGWTPATLIWDVTTEFTDALGRPYVPRNYDGQEHGPVRVRRALAQSLNIPAVKTLDYVGLPAMLDMAHRMGITSLNRADYGLSLTLGGGEVTLLEMTGAYAVFANGGRRVDPVSILRIEDSAGRIIEEHRRAEGQQVISPQHAYLITDILADNRARAGVFGADSALKLSRPAAAKTGTTDDWRDAWTIGYTPDLVTGVWTGNADNSPMEDVSGVRGAGPIWHAFMERALADQPISQFPRPEGIVEIEISTDSGSLPSAACPHDRRRTEIFAVGQGPLGAEYDFHQYVRVDTTTGALATEFCPPAVVEERYFFVLPGDEGKRWAEDKNIPQPPEHLCPVHTGPAQIAISQPLAGETVTGDVYIMGRANLADFWHYVVEYGVGGDPIGWGTVAGPVYAPVDGGLLAVWNTRSLINRDYSLRVVVYDRLGNGVEARTWVVVLNPTPTLTSTPTLTATQTPTPSPIITLPPVPTIKPIPSLTPQPTWTPSPTLTPEPRPTPPLTKEPPP